MMRRIKKGIAGLTSRPVGLLTLVGLSFWGVGGSAWAESAPPVRAERLRFDSSTGDWIELAEPIPGTDEGDLALARAIFAKSDYKPARKAMRAWMKSYGATSALYPQAVLLQAKIEKGLRNYHASYELLDGLLDQYAHSEVAAEVGAELFNIAEVYLSGVKRKLWGLRLLSATDLALNILDDLTVLFPDSSLAELAIKTKADYYHNNSDFLLAELEYAQLVQTFPTSRYRRYAMRRSADAAQAGFGGIKFDDAPLIEAEERYRTYALQYRGQAEQEDISLILLGISERRAAKELDIGQYYEKTLHPRAAAFYYRSVIEYWPDTVAARKAEQALSRFEGPMEESETMGTSKASDESGPAMTGGGP